MNKKIIITAITLILIILWLTWYYFKDTILNTKDSFSNTNSAKTVPELISKNYLKEFHHLNLRTKKLWEMPDICKMVKGTNYEYDIWSLDLADNEITEIDKDLSCLKNLQDLYLSFNKIKEIDNLEELNFIKKLDLGNNEITEIDNLDKLTTLSDLHLWYNKLNSTKWLEKLTNLTSLKLQHNEITDLSWVKNLSKLSELKLEFNKLDESDLKDISKFKKLKIITVAENIGVKQDTIKKLSDYTYKNMQKIEKDSWETNSGAVIELKK